MKVSALVLTFNEEKNLPACLTALEWCDDVVVLDSGSTDRTVEIARAHGARVLLRPFDDFARQRNFGLDRGEFRHQWVLHLDADEVATPQFVAQLTALEPQPGIDAWRVPSKTILFGRWLRYAGMYPAFQVRIGHRERLRFKQVGHGQREDLAPERLATFREPYLHYNFSHGLRAWFEKHIRYAEAEARTLLELRATRPERTPARDATSRRRAFKALTSPIPLWLRPIGRFLYILIVRQGFRDGRAGLAYALMLAAYECMIAAFAYSAIFAGAETKSLDDRKLATPPLRNAAGRRATPE